MKLFNLLILGLFSAGIAQAEVPTDSPLSGEQTRSQQLHPADSNADGVLDQQEFIQAAERRFQMIDKNGDGVISRQEGRQARRARLAKIRARIKARRARMRQGMR